MGEKLFPVFPLLLGVKVTAFLVPDLALMLLRFKLSPVPVTVSETTTFSLFPVD